VANSTSEEKKLACTAGWRSKNKEHTAKYNHDYHVAHYHELAEKIRARSSARYKAKKEEILLQSKERHKLNKERNAAIKRLKYRADRERILEKSKKYQKEHPEVARASAIRRRAIKNGAPLGDTKLIAAWMREMKTRPFVRCHWCGTKIHGSQLHFDHIVALSKGGSHSIGNLCTACGPCNRSKSARLISDWIVGGQTFLSL
jgi:5-methylcytosine-specific restriction endonuclease McrA